MLRSLAAPGNAGAPAAAPAWLGLRALPRGPRPARSATSRLASLEKAVALFQQALQRGPATRWRTPAWRGAGASPITTRTAARGRWRARPRSARSALNDLLAPVHSRSASFTLVRATPKRRSPTSTARSRSTRPGTPPRKAIAHLDAWPLSRSASSQACRRAAAGLLGNYNLARAHYRQTGRSRGGRSAPSAQAWPLRPTTPARCSNAAGALAHRGMEGDDEEACRGARAQLALRPTRGRVQPRPGRVQPRALRRRRARLREGARTRRRDYRVWRNLGALATTGARGAADARSAWRPRRGLGRAQLQVDPKDWRRRWPTSPTATRCSGERDACAGRRSRAGACVERTREVAGHCGGRVEQLG